MLLENVPDLHSVGEVEPARQYPPASHVEHASSVDSPVALEKEPAGHAVIVVVSGQKNPSGHERGASDPGGQ